MPINNFIKNKNPIWKRYSNYEMKNIENFNENEEILSKYKNKLNEYFSNINFENMDNPSSTDVDFYRLGDDNYFISISEDVVMDFSLKMGEISSKVFTSDEMLGDFFNNQLRFIQKISTAEEFLTYILDIFGNDEGILFAKYYLFEIDEIEIRQSLIDAIINYENFSPSPSNFLPTPSYNFYKDNEFNTLFDKLNINIDESNISESVYNMNYMAELFYKVRKLNSNLSKYIVINKSFGKSLNLTIDSISYEVEIKYSLFTTINSYDMPWYDNQDLALKFAESAANKFNIANIEFDIEEPLFIYDFKDGSLVSGYYFKNETGTIEEVIDADLNSFKLIACIKKTEVMSHIDMFKYGKVINLNQYNKEIYGSKRDIFLNGDQIENVNEFFLKKLKLIFYIYKNKAFKSIIFGSQILIYYNDYLLSGLFIMVKFDNDKYLPIIDISMNQVRESLNSEIILKHVIEEVSINYTDYNYDALFSYNNEVPYTNTPEATEYGEYIDSYDNLFSNVQSDNFGTYYLNRLKYPDSEESTYEDIQLSDELKVFFNHIFISEILKKWNTLELSEKPIYFYGSSTDQFQIEQLLNFLESPNSRVVENYKFNVVQPSNTKSYTNKISINKMLEENEKTVLVDKILLIFDFYIYNEGYINQFILLLPKMTNNMVVPFFSYLSYLPIPFASKIPESAYWFESEKNNNGGFNYSVKDNLTEIEIYQNAPIILGKGDNFDGRNIPIYIKNVNDWIGLFFIDFNDVNKNIDEKYHPIIQNINIDATSSIIVPNCGILTTTPLVMNELLENNFELLYLSESFKFLGNSIKDESNVPESTEYSRFCSYLKVVNCTVTFANLEDNCGGICGSYAGFNGKFDISNCKANGISIQDYSGAICGPYSGATGYCNITLCSYKGDINGKFAGGICGSNSASIGDEILGNTIYGTCIISLSNFIGIINNTAIGAGGIVGGYAGEGNGLVQIKNCFSGDENLSCDKNAQDCGGICGAFAAIDKNSDHNNVSIYNCYSIGEIGINAGGICGSKYCKYGLMVIDTCYSSGEINLNAGGICGADGLENGNLVISNCYSTGNIGKNAGGICGFKSSSGGNINIYHCYSAANYIDDNGGGILGANSKGGNIELNCVYAAAHEFGENSGGLAGFNSHINKNYNTYSEKKGICGYFGLDKINYMKYEVTNDMLSYLNNYGSSGPYWIEPDSFSKYINYNDLSSYNTVVINDSYAMDWKDFSNYMTNFFIIDSIQTSEFSVKIKSLINNNQYVQPILFKEIESTYTKLINIKNFSNSDSVGYIFEPVDQYTVYLYKFSKVNDNISSVHKFINNFALVPIYPLLSRFAAPPFAGYITNKSNPYYTTIDDLTESTSFMTSDSSSIDVDAGGISTNILIIIIAIILLVYIIKKLLERYHFN